MNSLETVLQQVVHCLDQKQGDDILVFDCPDSTLTEHVVLASARNHIHCDALVGTVLDTFSKKKYAKQDDLYIPPKLAGEPNSGWIILDLNSILIHIMLDTVRDHYQMDALFTLGD